jgi:hypothetical protein
VKISDTVLSLWAKLRGRKRAEAGTTMPASTPVALPAAEQSGL